MTQKLLLIKRRNRICMLTLNRPEKKNSLLQKFTIEMALEIAEHAPLALKGIKRVIHLLMQANQLDKKSAKEAETIFRAALSSEDMQEGQAAFLEKRKPHVKGK